MKLKIEPAYNKLDTIRELFNEYVSELGVDLSFQDYQQELLSLPTDYTCPNGRLYIAYYNYKPAGCIALRPFDNECCEIKRLFVRPEFRGKRIGLALIETIISDTTEMKYKSVVLDTLASQSASISLYKKLSFRFIQPYRYNPLPNAIFFRLEL